MIEKKQESREEISNKDFESVQISTPTATNLEKQETIEKTPKDGQIQEVSTEEFKDVGGGFFIKNVTITGIDYDVKISGALRNSSGNFHSVVEFLVKFFDEEKKLVHMHNFTVSGIADKSIVEFSEALTGISSKDFDFYKINFLSE